MTTAGTPHTKGGWGGGGLSPNSVHKRKLRCATPTTGPADDEAGRAK